MALFERTGLEQDTGLLKERWGQEGSEIVNISEANVSSDTSLYTVTTGKVLYIKQIFFVDASGLTGEFYLKDGSGGSTKFTGNTYANNGSYSLVFDAPLKFEDSVYFDEAVGVGVNITLSGWEE